MRFCVEGKCRVKVSDFCHNCGVGNCFARVGRMNCFYHYGNDYALGNSGVGERKGNFGYRGNGCEKRCVNREGGVPCVKVPFLRFDSICAAIVILSMGMAVFFCAFFSLSAVVGSLTWGNVRL